MLSVILVCGLCAYVIMSLRVRIKNSSLHKLPPLHPGWLPIIGHTHYLLTNTKKLWQRILWLTDNCIKAGGVICLQLGWDIYYIITDPEDALTVANSCLQKHFAYDFGKNWLGDGLITGSGEIYSRHRKLLQPGHSVPMVLGFLEVFNTQAAKLTRIMEDYVGKGQFNPKYLIQSVIIETACLTTFGSKVTDNDFLKKYTKAVDEILRIYVLRFQRFYFQSDFIYKLLGYQKKEDQLVETLTKLSNDIIQKKKAAMSDASNDENQLVSLDNPEIRYEPFLDLLLELSMKGLLTDEEILSELSTNVVAAYETTSHIIEVILVFLGTYPEAQEKIFEEVKQVVGLERDVDKNDIPKLVYTKAVIKETLRLMPIGPALARYVNKEVKLKNYTMRSNCHAVILTPGIHRSSSMRPEDDQFKPERWLDPESSALCKSFAGFSLGKRSCIGQAYAMTTLPTILAHLVRQYTWSADLTNLVMQFDATLKPSSGQEISIRRRKE